MTALNLATLSSISAVSFNDFKTAYQGSVNIAAEYYTALAGAAYDAGQASTQNYASRNEDIANNAGVRGVYENEFSKVSASDDTIDMTVGSDAWLRVQYDKMEADYAARQTSIANSGTGELRVDETMRVIERSYENVDLPPGTSLIYAPLNTLVAANPESAQLHFDAYNSPDSSTGDGLTSMLVDSLGLGFGALVHSPDTLSGMLDSWSSQAHWMSLMLQAGENILNANSEGLPDDIQTPLDEIEALLNLAGGELGVLAHWADQLAGGASLGGLASWISAAKTPWNAAFNATSPLVLDLTATHTGIALTTFNAATTTTFFDIDNSGYATQTAWVGADMGLLCRDLNSNGRIDNAGELFGSSTVDGFALLSQLDSNGDHRIDQYDSAWSTLKIWVDANGDAVTQSGELHSMSDLGVASIDLAAVASSTSTVSGNPISHTSFFTFTSGATATVADAWFVHDKMNSYYTGDYTLDVDTLFLPTLRGFGTLPDLAIAESQNSTLKGLVSDFASGFSFASFADPASLDAAITNILYHWAGVESVSPSSRGPNVDARTLEFLEHLFGQDFVRPTYTDPTDPSPGSAEKIMQSWDAAFNAFKDQLLIQSGASALFSHPVSYDPSTGAIVGDLALSHDAIDALDATAPAPGAANLSYWSQIAHFIDDLKGFDNLTGDENTWLNAAVNASDSSLSWDDVKNALSSPAAGTIIGTNSDDVLAGTMDADIIYGHGGHDTIYGEAGNDTLHGGNGGSTLYGGDGDDYIDVTGGSNVLYGGSGNDTLYGYTGNDTLSGGAGGNILKGYGGNDTFVFGGGDDVILAGGGSDQIVMPAGVALSDLTFTRISSDGSTTAFNDMMITVATGGSIQIQQQFGTNGYQVETMVFDDASTLNLTNVSNYDVVLTGGDDGFSPGGSLAFHVQGMDGDDFIQTGSGADTLDGGTGNDSLHGATGNDIYVASPGFDTISDTGGSDTILMPSGVTADDVHLLRHIGTPDNLEITIDGLGQIIVTGQYTNAAYAVEQIAFSDSSTLNLTAHEVYTVGTTGNDSFIYGVSGGVSNIIDGRGGNDALSGYTGNDTFVFATGHSTVSDSGGTDTIRFGGAWAVADISIYRGGLHGTDLVFQDTNGDTMTVTNQFVGGTHAVEHATFADSTTLNLTTMAMETHGTSGSDVFNYTAGSQADTIYGYAGNDQLYGGAGVTTIYGGDGTDQVYAGTGNTTLSGGDGSDYLSGNTGTDTFLFLSGETGSDTISGFSTAQGDKIDIHDLLVGYDPLTSAITDFVHVTASGSNAILSVDANGATGGASFTQIATLSGLSSLAGHEADLLANGNLIAHAA